MKKLYSTVFYLLIPAMLVMYGCKKDPNQNTQIHSIDKSLQPYVFNAGSYYLYRNDSGWVDSVVIESVKHSNHIVKAFDNDTPQYRYEYVTMNFWSPRSGERYNEQAFSRFINRGAAEGDPKVHGNMTMIAPGKKGDSAANDNSAAAISEIYDSFLVDTLYYKNVIRMNLYVKDNNVFKSSGRYFYAPNVGLIRKELPEAGGTAYWDIIKVHH